MKLLLRGDRKVKGKKCHFMHQFQGFIFLSYLISFSVINSNLLEAGERGMKKGQPRWE